MILQKLHFHQIISLKTWGELNSNPRIFPSALFHLIDWVNNPHKSFNKSSEPPLVSFLPEMKNCNREDLVAHGSPWLPGCLYLVALHKNSHCFSQSSAWLSLSLEFSDIGMPFYAILIEVGCYAGKVHYANTIHALCRHHCRCCQMCIFWYIVSFILSQLHTWKSDF